MDNTSLPSASNLVALMAGNPQDGASPWGAQPTAQTGAAPPDPTGRVALAQHVLSGADVAHDTLVAVGVLAWTAVGIGVAVRAC